MGFGQADRQPEAPLFCDWVYLLAKESIDLKSTAASKV
jgi:hypothetical protein